MKTREQQRAFHAYRCVQTLADKGEQELVEAYKVGVNGLGSSVLRCGLAVSLAFLERDQGNAAARALLDDLAQHLLVCKLPGLEGVKDGKELARRVREELKLEEYMLASREVLRLALWLRRAVQATFASKRSEGKANAQATE